MVQIYSIEKSIADAFRNPKLVDRSVAFEALRSALVQRKARPVGVMQAAADNGVGKIMRPYLEALTGSS